MFKKFCSSYCFNYEPLLQWFSWKPYVQCRHRQGSFTAGCLCLVSAGIWDESKRVFSAIPAIFHFFCEVWAKFNFSSSLSAWPQTAIQSCFLSSPIHETFGRNAVQSYSPVNWSSDISSSQRLGTLKCQMPQSGMELNSWNAICKLFWMTKSIHSL